MQRRAVLRLLGAGVVGTYGLACSSAAPNVQTRQGASSAPHVILPTYVPFQGPPADVPGSADGVVSPAYFNYPLNPTKSVQEPVGHGEDVTAVTYTTQAPPTGVEQNMAWQRVNQETGFNVKLPQTQLADYPTKLNTTIAGGQSSLPDLLSLSAGNGLGISGLLSSSSLSAWS